MRKARRVLAILVAAMALCGPGFAADYYIAPSGADTNAGTSAKQAWKSLAPVNAKTFAPGDRILFEAGSHYSGQLKPQGSGAEGKPIVIDMYGPGAKPRIDGEGQVDAAVLLFNVEYWEVNNLEVTNTTAEPSGKQALGVYVHIKDFGTARHIVLKKLNVHDISGRGKHDSKSGDGIGWLNEGESKKSCFDGLRIEGCTIAKVHLNGIWGWSEHWQRDAWFPSHGVVVRDNVISDTGYSGIVPVGCDGAVIERNRIIRPSRNGDGGIGIWPWSCDNTVIQFNEVSGSQGVKDSQAFDSDWNCRNSLFQYNYSHDNKGGFVLICTEKLSAYNLGCENTVVRYNVSENDGGIATQVFCIAGPCKNTYIYNNTIYVSPDIKVNLIEHWEWNGWAANTFFSNNAVYADGRLTFTMGASTINAFSNNAWFGNLVEPPNNPNGVTADPKLTKPGHGGAIDDTRKLASLEAYRLQAGSPLIDKGQDLHAALGIDVGKRDYFGTTIPAGAGFDIGACEYTTVRPLRILPLGDSITESDSKHAGYRYSLWKLLVDAGKPFDFIGSMATPDETVKALCPDYKGFAFDPDHEGHAGWTAAEIVEGCSWAEDKGKLSEWLKTYTPDVVLMHLGSNDVFHTVATDEIVEKLGNVITTLQAANPAVTIYLAKIIPLGGEWAPDFNGRVVELNGRIDGVAVAKSTAASKVVVVDQYNGFDGVKDTHDRIHPNESGEAKMARRWADAILFDGTPVAREDRYAAVQENRLTVSAATGVLANDYAAGAALRAVVVEAPANGALTLNPDGGFEYAPKAGFVGADKFTYKGQAGSVSSAVCAVTIDVADNAPTAKDDWFGVAGHTPLAVDATGGLLSNDVSYKGALRAALVAEPKNGKVTVNADGGFTYTANEGFIGADEFTYSANDGEKTSAPARVSLCVGHAEPVARWKFDETSGAKAADAAGGGHDGVLNKMDADVWVADGAVRALRFDGKAAYVSATALNLNTNWVTVTAWVKRSGDESPLAAFVSFGEGDARAGLGFGSGPNWEANHELGYLWNAMFWGWHSGITIPDNEWRLTALVVTPEQATVYLGGSGALFSASNRWKHDPEKLNTATRIGADGQKGGRFFRGLLRDVRVYDRPLSKSEVQKLADEH